MYILYDDSLGLFMRNQIKRKNRDAGTQGKAGKRRKKGRSRKAEKQRNREAKKQKGKQAGERRKAEAGKQGKAEKHRKWEPESKQNP